MMLITLRSFIKERSRKILKLPSKRDPSQRLLTNEQVPKPAAVVLSKSISFAWVFK